MARAGRLLLFVLLAAGIAPAKGERPAIRVRVVTFDGVAVAGARVEARRPVEEVMDPMWPGAGAKTIDAWWKRTHAGADDSLVAQSTTDADGWARFNRLPDGAFDLTAHAAGRAVRGAQVLWPPVRGAPPPKIVLDAGHALAGRVTGEDGSAVGSALVVVRFAAAGAARWDSRERPIVTKADESGAFRIDGVPEGTVVLQASPPATWFDRRHILHVPQQEPAKIVLPLYPCNIVVKDARTCEPVAGAPVVFATFGFHMSSTLLRGVTNAKGRLRLRSPNRWLALGEVHSRGFLRELRRGAPPFNLEELAGREVEFAAVPTAAVRGTVRDAAGPVAGAVVRATRLDGFDLKIARTRSAADGTFELWLGEGLIHLMAERAGSLAVDLELDVPLATGKDGERGLVHVPATGRDGIALDLPPAQPTGRVTGRVVTADGAPASVSMRLGDRRSVRVDAAGRFDMEGVPAGEAPLSVRTVRGSRIEADPVQVVAGKTTSGVEIIVPVTWTARVEGRVGAPKGSYVIDSSDDRRHTIASDGRFSFDTRAGEVEIEIVCPDGRGAVARATCKPGATAQLGEIALDEPSVAAFRVVSTSGAPIAGATAQLYSPPTAIGCGSFERPSDLRLWRADNEGRIRMPFPRRGNWLVKVRASRFAGRDVPGADMLSEVMLPGLAELAGRARFAGGRPAAGVLVRAYAEGATYGWRETVADADGRFRLEGLAASAHGVHLESTSGGASIIEKNAGEFAVPGKPLDLVVEAALTIEGRLVDARGRPVADAQVMAIPVDDEDAPELDARTDSRGVFRLAGALAGKYKLEVYRPTRIGAEPAVVVAGKKDVVLRADCGHRISGRLVDGQGRPRAGWAVGAVQEERGVAESRARTDAEGRFVLEDLEGGVWKLKVGCWNHREADSGGDAVPAGKQDVVLVLK